MYNEFLTYITENGLFPAGEAFTIAFSGGIDSSVLMHLLISINKDEQMGWSITAAHFNHQIREEAASDEVFCRKQAGNAGIPFMSETRDVPAYCKQKGISLETGARECRLRFFCSLEGPIVLAHHHDDQIETVLHNIIRGTGIKGLSGIRERSEIDGQTLIRPLLSFTKTQLKGYAEQKKMPFVQDSSNSDPAFTRNRLRHQVIPYLQEINPAFGEHLAAMAASAGAAWEALSTDPRLKACFAAPKADYIEMDIDRVRDLPRALQAMALYMALEKLGIDISRRAVEKALELLSRPEQGTVCAELAGGGEIRREYDRLILRKAASRVPALAAVELPIPGKRRLAGMGVELTAEVERLSPDLLALIASNPDPMIGYLDRGLISGDSLTIRTRRGGDRFHPLGAPGERKLQDFLVDVKCPLAERDQVLLAEGSQGIAWVAGYRPSERFKVREDTAQVLKLQLQRS
jgi:tRNA(Ile)-lysidine synthase